MQTDQITTTPVIKTVTEFSDLIVSFWVQMIEQGHFEMPFKGNSKMDELANMIRFTKTSEDKKIFSTEQIDLLKKQTKEVVETELAKRRRLHGYTTYASPMGYLKQIFEGIDVPHGRFPFEMATIIFQNEEHYRESLESVSERCGGKEGVEKIMATYPHDCAVFCKRASGDYWHIVTGIDLHKINLIALAPMFFIRISAHSKKIEHPIREKVEASKDILQNAEKLSNKLYNEEDVDKNEIDTTLKTLQEMRSLLIDRKIERNHHYLMILDSVENLITAFS